MAERPVHPAADGFSVHEDLRRAVFVANPNAAQFRQTPEGRTDYGREVALAVGEVVLIKEIPKTETFETTGNREADEAALKNLLRDGDVVIPIGGDGNSNLVINALRSDELSGKIIPIFPYPGGGVNDLARNLTGNPQFTSFGELLTDSSIVPLHAIKYRISAEEDEEARAALYSGLGSVADLARQFNATEFRERPGHRHKPVRRAYQSLATGRKLFHPENIEIEEIVTDQDGGERTGPSRVVNEYVVTANPEMATQLHFPVEFAEPRAWVTEADGERFAGGTLWLAQALMGRTEGEFLEIGETRRLKLGTDAQLHLDAEDKRLETGTVLEISMDDMPYWALTTTIGRSE